MKTKAYNVMVKALKERAESNLNIAVFPPRGEVARFARELGQDLRELYILENNAILYQVYNGNPWVMTELPRIELGKGMTKLGVFQKLSEIKTADLTGWNITGVFSLDMLFYGCDSIETIDITGWDTSKITRFGSAFSFCGKLKEIKGVIDMSSCKTIKDYQGMFSGCYDLAGVKIKNPPYGKNDVVPGQDKPFYKVLGFDSPGQYEIVE